MYKLSKSIFKRVLVHLFLDSAQIYILYIEFYHPLRRLH